MTALLAGSPRRARVVLRPGLSLFDAVCAAMAPIGWPSATLLLLGGPMARAVFHTSALTPGGPRWIDYGPARTVPDPAWLVMGSATFGRAEDGSPVLHCHAVLSGADGLAGGHLAPGRCVIGATGLVAYATSGGDAGFAVQDDPATGFQLLAPRCLESC